MKEPKFKFWHKLHKKFGNSREYALTGDGYIYYIDLTKGIFLCDTGNIISVMYTGLKDKNNKEIYEGDIVKYEWTNQLCVVKYSISDICDREGASYPGFTIESDCPHKLEVIGNIYENPELLEKEVKGK